MSINNDHYENPSAGILLLTRDVENRKQILLQHRGNTRMLPNIWDCISGHVEKGESVTQAIAREAMEELGIQINPSDLQFVGLTHLQLEEGLSYYNVYFTTDKYVGDPSILEPEKHDDLKWFDINSLEAFKDDIVENRYDAIQNLGKPALYTEENF